MMSGLPTLAFPLAFFRICSMSRRGEKREKRGRGKFGRRSTGSLKRLPKRLDCVRDGRRRERFRNNADPTNPGSLLRTRSQRPPPSFLCTAERVMKKRGAQSSVLPSPPHS